MYFVTGVTPSSLQIEIANVAAYESQEDSQKLSIGSYLKISDDKGLSLIAIVQSFRVKDSVPESPETEPAAAKFIIEAQQLGCFKDGKFKRGGQQIAIPPAHVELATGDDLALIYADVPPSKRFDFGSLAQDSNIRATLDGDKFFGKHIGVVGSTGSGKSCTVAKILQEGIGTSDDQTAKRILNNSHIIIFDLHGEYASAFPKAKILNIENLVLPYWLMNAEELEELFIESRETNSHNQRSQFKLAVIRNKQRHNKGLKKITYDTPLYFSIEQVYQFICNQNIATKDAKTGEIKIKSPVAEVDDEYQFFEKLEFEEKAREKINGAPYHGEFDRFVSRLETLMNDDRLEFFLAPQKVDGSPYKSDDLGDILRQFTGYITEGKGNVTIVDLSGIPFEVLSLAVSLITRLIFDFCFHYKRLKTTGEEVPFLMVYEEAHNYVPQSESAKYRSVKQSIERVAKEGRKYGLSLMIVSQRPSDISETIFSQCNNFVAMRLTNPSDQQYVKRLLPDSVNAITDTLPVLEKREAIVIGDAISIPSIICVDGISDRPSSQDIDFHTEWKKDWLDVEFQKIVDSITKKSGVTEG